jgi:hypothetical protein
MSGAGGGTDLAEFLIRSDSLIFNIAATIPKTELTTPISIMSSVVSADMVLSKISTA